MRASGRRVLLLAPSHAIHDDHPSDQRDQEESGDGKHGNDREHLGSLRRPKTRACWKPRDDGTKIDVGHCGLGATWTRSTTTHGCTRFMSQAGRCRPILFERGWTRSPRHLPATRPLVWLDLGSGTGRMTPALASAFGGARLRSRAVRQDARASSRARGSSRCHLCRIRQRDVLGGSRPAARSSCRRTSPTGCLMSGGSASCRHGRRSIPPVPLRGSGDERLHRRRVDARVS